MIYRGKDPNTQKVVECEVADGKITRLSASTPGKRGANDVGGDDVYLSPGFIDIQVNGFGGVDLESRTVTPGDVVKVMEAQWPFGVTQFLPTIVTGSAERICRGLRAVADAVEQSSQTRAAVPGIHLEGPYFCPDEGPRGAHPVEHVRKPTWEEFRKFQDAARGMITMVTLAPEIEGALPFIERLSSEGIIPAIGHCNAKEADIDAAIKAGAKISTHLGNGSHNMLPRHANYIQMQLSRDELWASLITDGHHLPPYFVKNAVRAKHVDRCILTTDAMSGAGAPPGRYRIDQIEVVVGPDKMVRHPVSACLAGSAATLDDCISNVIRWAGISLAEGLAMATAHPAQLLGLKSYGLAMGKAANLVLFRRDDGGLKVTHTVLNGTVVFGKSR